MNGREALERLLQKLELDRGPSCDDMDAEQAYLFALGSVCRAIEAVLRESPPSTPKQGEGE